MAVILLLSISLTSFASNTYKAPGFVGIENFNKTFPQAVITEYKSKGDFTEVSFVWNGLNLVAFFSDAGELVATSRTIALANLPVAAQLRIKANYSDYIPHNAIEFDDAENGLCYYVIVANEKKSLLLHVTAEGTISVFKKMSN